MFIKNLLFIKILSFGLISMAMEKEAPRSQELQRNLFNAIERGDISGVKAAIRNGADVNSVGDGGYGVTPLTLAAGLHNYEGYYIRSPKLENSKSKEIIKLLLQNGAKLPNQEALRALAVEVVGWINSQERSAIAPDKNDVIVGIYTVINAVQNELSGKTDLHLAARYNDLDSAIKLINNYADVNARDYNQNTPLHEAAYYGNMQIVRLLLRNGADINAKDKDGTTAYQKAIYGNSPKVAEFLKNYK